MEKTIKDRLINAWEIRKEIVRQVQHEYKWKQYKKSERNYKRISGRFQMLVRELLGQEATVRLIYMGDMRIDFIVNEELLLEDN
jgi:hypothetical protein